MGLGGFWFDFFRLSFLLVQSENMSIKTVNHRPDEMQIDADIHLNFQSVDNCRFLNDDKTTVYSHILAL